MPATAAGASLARTSRSSAPALALMPQCSADERKPCAAVTPPSAFDRDTPRTADETLAMERCQRHERLDAVRERKCDGVLSAVPEQRARAAIGFDLLGNPRVRDDRE